ncbi:histidinol dehydrogenase [Caldalkalibacillus salinus]|uniref:histidinol dehydrogenase n=1 Tax=Caldalkalibacillus salinus TaxID=2803787 RepID=UPI003B005C7C
MRITDQLDEVSLRRNIGQGTDAQRQSVLNILQRVKKEGDKALYHLTLRLDGVSLDDLRVSEAERKAAYDHVDEEAVTYFQEAIQNIERYHQKQVKQSWIDTRESGTLLGMKIQPLDRVGVYVPGGTAALLSSVLMTVIPAKVAGVKEIVMVTPPQKDGTLTPAVLVAADLLGVTEIYKAGGAQAIGALTYGTDTIQPVDKIVGPGNIYVALAKREVFGTVDIDMVAGPSEIVVLADEEQNPAYIAADLLSQAEHDPMSSSVLVTPSHTLAQRVQSEVETQIQSLPRKAIATASIRDYGAIYVTETLEEAVHAVNEIAPEHLELLVQDPFKLLGNIRHAGAIFLGEYSSEPVGDYFAGPNHVLPTNGTARFASPLNVDDFTKKSSIISYSEQDLLQNAHKIMALARYEGLEGHAQAIQKRVEATQQEEEDDGES